MSYRSPTEPKYVPTSGAVNRMQQNLVSAAEEQLKAKKEREDEIIAEKTLDRQVAIGYGKTLGEATKESQISGVLDTTYKGYNKEAAALERTMREGKCKEAGCEMETKQLQILTDAPNASIDLLANVQANIDTALGGNVDKTHYLYNKLEIAGRVIGKQNFYGSDDGYGITVNRLKDDNGNYTGQQEIIFTGKEFGEGGWKINSGKLSANPELISETPSFADQSANTTETSGILAGDRNPQNAVVYSDRGLEQGLDVSFASTIGYQFDATQTAAFNKAKELNPELTQAEYAKKNGIKGRVVPGEYNTRIEQLEYTNDEGEIKAYTAKVYVFDEELIKARLKPEISADIDTMFDRKVGGPDDAIALFNETFTDKNTGNYAVTEEDIKKYPWLTKKGKINYLAGIPSENDFGEPGSIYDNEGKLKSEVKELYQKIYADHYMRETVLPKMKNIEVPGTAIGAAATTTEDFETREFEINQQAEADRLAAERANANKKYAP